MDRTIISRWGGCARRKITSLACGALIATGLVFGAASPALAIPANPNPVTQDQPSGATFVSHVYGDESFHFVTNDDDVVVLRNADDQVWYQVVKTDDGLALGPQAQAAADGNALLRTELGDEEIRADYDAFIGANTDSAITLSEPGDPITVEELVEIQDDQPESPNNQFGDAKVTLPLVTIVVGFEDEPYRTDYDWYKQFFSQDYSVSSLYYLSSNGKFTWAPAQETSEYGKDGNTNKYDNANDGVIHVTLDKKYGDYDIYGYYPEWHPDDPYGGADYNDDVLAIVAQAAKYIDLAQYDLNENGIIEPNELGFGLVFAGYEMASGYVPHGSTHSIWSHMWDFASLLDDGSAGYVVSDANGAEVALTNFVIQSETEAYNTGTGCYEVQAGIGALGHELGHFIGLPDLYSTSWDYDVYTNYNTGYLSIMDGGSWGMVQETGEYRPTFFDPECRLEMGWIEPEVITEAGTYTAFSQMSDEGYNCYKIDVTEDEYYLIENRQFESFDEGMTRYYHWYYDNGGIVVWHIDGDFCQRYGLFGEDVSVYNTVNAYTHHPGIMNLFPGLTEENENEPDTYMPFLSSETEAILGSSRVNGLVYNGTDHPAERGESGIVISSSDEGGQAMDFTVEFVGAIGNAGAVDSDGTVSPYLPTEGGTITLSATVSATTPEDAVVTAEVYLNGELVEDEWAQNIVLTRAGIGGAQDGPAARSANSGDAVYTTTITVPENTTTQDQWYVVRYLLNGETAYIRRDFTVAEVPAELTGAEVTPSALTAEGGTVEVTVKAANVDETDYVAAVVYKNGEPVTVSEWDWDAYGYVIVEGEWAYVELELGEDGTYTGTIEFPANEGDEDAVYEVRFLLNDDEVSFDTEVTVAAAEQTETPGTNTGNGSTGTNNGNGSTGTNSGNSSSNGNNSGTGNGSTTGTTTGSGSHQGKGAPNAPAKAAKGNLPATGDSHATLIAGGIAVVGVAAVAGGVLYLRRRNAR